MLTDARSNSNKGSLKPSYSGGRTSKRKSRKNIKSKSRKTRRNTKRKSRKSRKNTKRKMRGGNNGYTINASGINKNTLGLANPMPYSAYSRNN